MDAAGTGGDMMGSRKRKTAMQYDGHRVFPSNKRKKPVVSVCTLLLPHDMMLEVLLRLPVKSVLRFRAVCRSWDALFSSKDFCSLHMATYRVPPSAPKLLLVSPTSRLDSSAVYSYSLSGHRDDLFGHIRRELSDPQVVRVIGSVGNCKSGKKIVITTSKHSVYEKFQKKVHIYDPRCQVLQCIRSVTETHTSASHFIPGSRFSLFEESLAPVHKTDEDLAAPSTLAKVIGGNLLAVARGKVGVCGDQSLVNFPRWRHVIVARPCMKVGDLHNF